MTEREARRLIGIVIDAHRIAWQFDEKEDPMTFGEIDSLCSDLVEYAVAMLAEAELQMVPLYGETDCFRREARS